MVKIISDSTCDLEQETCDRYGIGILPLHVVLGENEYLDRIEITNKEIFSWADANQCTPKTSAPSIDDAINLFKQELDKGNDIVAFCISESMSSSGRVMRLAAEELEASDRIHVIDSHNLSGGIAVQAVIAAELAMEGKGATEIVAEIESIQDKVRCSFVVDTLEYLHRGGRCSGLAAMLGSTLKLHPTIVVNNGVMGASKKYRGRIEKAALEYFMDQEEDIKNADPARAFIIGPMMDKNMLDSVYNYTKSLNVFKEIIICEAGGVISSHCGPGTVGIIYKSK